MRCTALVLLVLPALLSAKPNLGEYLDIEGVRVYRDHKQASLWYPAPAPPTAAVHPQGGPDYALDLHRYMGRSGTGDRALFWARGVLNLGFARAHPTGTVAGIKAGLRKAGVGAPRLRSMPVASARVRLLFADQTRSWEQGAHWSGGRLVLPLDEVLAQVLWNAVQAEQTVISVEVEERLAGVRADGKAWKQAETAASWTLPVELDAKTYPQRFRKTDLGGEMGRGYTEMDVFCFDFLEGLEPELYAKLVEVAIPTAGRALVQQARFDARSAYRMRLRFPLAKDLDVPYRVRVTRIYTDGRRQAGAWEHKSGEAMLDVTSYREPQGESPEDRGSVQQAE